MTMKRETCRISKAFAILAGGTALIAMLGTAAMAADSSAADKKIEMSFDLSKCQPQGPNLYKCPAVDKPICTQDFAQPNVECIRVGKKGNVFVMMPGNVMP
jgi:hypothetical protein